MDGVPFNTALLERLAAIEGQAAERALFQALEAAHDALQAAVLKAILQRGSKEIHRRLARLLPALGEESRRVLQTDAAALEHVARVGLQSDDASVRTNVVQLLHQAGQPSCAYLLSSSLTDSVALVRTQAASGLRALVARSKRGSAAVAEFIAPAVADGVKRFSLHQLNEVVEAAILLGLHCPEDALKHMERPANRMSGPLAEAVRQIPTPECAEFVLSSLRYPHLAIVSQSYISNAPWNALAALAEKGHWLALQPVAKALTEITFLRAAADDPAGFNDLPESQQAAVLRLLMACGIPEATKDMLLGLALGGEASAAKAAVPFVLGRGSNATELILLALHSRHVEVQSVAAARIIAGGADAHVTEHLLESLPSLAAPVRGVVSQYIASDSFERYWRNFRNLGHELRQVAGKALLKLDTRVVDLLASRLISRDSNQQLQATQMVRSLKMVKHFENSLCQLARHADKTVRSAAAAALAEADSFNARSTLAGCLHDADSRVQANAVEALAALGDDASVILDKIHSPNNRVRGNAIKWLLEQHHEQGDLALAEMLTDTRTPHRISALWVAKVLKHKRAASLLDRMAVKDEDAKVRSRAATLLREWKMDPRLAEVGA